MRIREPEPGWKIFESGINIPDLQHCFLVLIMDSLGNRLSMTQIAGPNAVIIQTKITVSEQTFYLIFWATTLRFINIIQQP